MPEKDEIHMHVADAYRKAVTGDGGCGGGGEKIADADEIRRASIELAGKVSSALITARKPEHI
ncbi:MAG: hypothetical protein MAG453_01292 [Calditrichaeota bacterium]|nr:hypothetical protein [Calditrichota bacterium]